MLIDFLSRQSRSPCITVFQSRTQWAFPEKIGRFPARLYFISMAWILVCIRIWPSIMRHFQLYYRNLIDFTMTFVILIFVVLTSAQLITKECRERDRLVAAAREDLASLVDGLEGQTLILQCRFCNEDPDSQPKNWYRIEGLVSREVLPDMNNNDLLNRISINHKHSLIIKNLTDQDMGMYYCVHFQDKTNPEKFNFLVDLVYPDDQLVEKGSIMDWNQYHEDYFSPINNLLLESTAQDFIHLRMNLGIRGELVSQWGSWSKCEVCGRAAGDGVMKQRRVCRLKLTPLGGIALNVSVEEEYLLRAPAIACKSMRLMRLLPGVGSYTRKVPPFVLEEKCTGTCSPDAEGANQGWKVGKSKSFKYRKHSVLQENGHLTFICPESTMDNKVVWKKNGRLLKRGSGANPHVLVDTFNTLYLVDVGRADAGNYTCYVDDIQMEQIVVYVYSKARILTNEFVRYLMYLGFILFLSSFCYCAGLIITCRRRHLFKNYKELREEKPLV